ncbi:MAG TPA: hypothetical protein ENF95_01295 [Candidatus Aenigmarchaeota archaeon]|nr:hypothetical protein [Candidatus Aenigmarchaeota archaeon]
MQKINGKYHYEPNLSVDMDVFPFRDLQDLVKIRKPVVSRKGRVVTECHFFKSTGQCFGTRCFWTKNGECPFFNKMQKKSK